METLEVMTLSGRFDNINREIHIAKDNIFVGLVIMLLSLFTSALCAAYYNEGNGGFEEYNVLFITWNVMAVLFFFFALYVFCVGISSIRNAHKRLNETTMDFLIFANR